MMYGIKRKLLCYFLVMIMCLGTVVAPAYAGENVVDDELRDALDILRLLELIPDYYDYNTPFETEVSRSEFADIVANIINLGEYQSDAMYYYDVQPTHFAYNSICALTEMGVLNGISEKRFEPDASIDKAAAYKILLSIMGYDDYVHYNGGYPGGCIVAAQKAGILVNSTSNNLTHADMFRIIYRALDAEVLKPVSFRSDGSYSSRKMENETLLSMYYDIYHSDGVVTGADFISLSDKNLDEADEVLIDDVLYVTELDIEPYLGENIEFYYHYDQKLDKRTVLWAKNNCRSNTILIDVDHNAMFNENTFMYNYSVDRNRKIQLDRSLLLIYNGRAIEDNYEEILNMPRYSIKFISTEGVYKTAIVKAYENYVVDTVDTKNAVIYDSIDPKRHLKLSENLYDYIKIAKVDGSEALVSDIKTGDILSVFLSKDKKRIEVIISVDSRGGVIKSITKEIGGYEILMNDKIYYLPLENYKNNFAAGDSVKLCMDYAGFVADVVVESGDSVAAYVVAIKKETGFDTVLKMKLFKSDGTMAIYDCAPNLKLDGKKRCSVDEVVNALSINGEFTPQLILVEINSAGKVRSIDTAAVTGANEPKESSLQPNMKYAERHYKIQGYFNFEAAINDQTIIFAVPMNVQNADDSDYRIMRKSEFRDDTKHNVMSYNIGVDTGYEQYIIKKESGSGMDYGYDLPLLVTNKGMKLNENGDAVPSLEGYQGEFLKTVLSNGEVTFDDINPGMVVRLRYMRDGSVAGKTILFDPDNPQSYYTTTAPFNNIYGVEVGFVNSIIGDVIKIGYGSGENVSHVTNMFSAPPILVYDKNNSRDSAYVGSFADAKQYKNVTDGCSTVVLLTSHCTPKLYIFYN